MMFASSHPSPVIDPDGKFAIFETVLTSGVTRQEPTIAEKWTLLHLDWDTGEEVGKSILGASSISAAGKLYELHGHTVGILGVEAAGACCDVGDIRGDGHVAAFGDLGKLGLDVRHQEAHVRAADSIVGDSGRLVLPTLQILD